MTDADYKRLRKSAVAKLPSELLRFVAGVNVDSAMMRFAAFAVGLDLLLGGALVALSGDRAFAAALRTGFDWLIMMPIYVLYAMAAIWVCLGGLAWVESRQLKKLGQLSFGPLSSVALFVMVYTFICYDVFRGHTSFWFYFYAVTVYLSAAWVRALRSVGYVPKKLTVKDAWAQLKAGSQARGSK